MQDLNKNNVKTFIKGLNKDSDPSFVGDGLWTHARNAVNNTEEGDVGSLSNEPSNYLCGTSGLNLPGAYKVIVGAVHIFSDKWLIFTTSYSSPTEDNSLGSEIGLFEENICSYRPILQSNCLNFNKKYLISGASREREDCSWEVYWADGLNPDRVLNIGNPEDWSNYQGTFLTGNDLNYWLNDNGDKLLWQGVPWLEFCPEGDCEICTQTNRLDCDKTRLAQIFKVPCLKTSLSDTGGSLRNGSYFAIANYSIKGVKIGDYSSPSNVQPLWYPDDLKGSLEINVEVDEDVFDEYELIIVSTINQNTVAKKIGTYSTKIKKIILDQIKEDLISIPIRNLPIQTPVYEKSEFMTEVNSYLLRVGPTSKFDFNYQPLANLIKSKWVSVEYPADYYMKGGSNPSFLRDENYAFFIRWIYDTGDKSSAYHIPGRPARLYNGVLENADYDVANSLTLNDKLFEVINTATITSTAQTILDDGGVIIAEGDMGYWESSELYPSDKPEIWNSSSQCWTGSTNTDFDLCGKNIRHHKFPENFIDNSPSTVTSHFMPNPNTTGNNYQKIRVLGVSFDNIIYPKDNEGNDIPGIVGYEILRGSREGNKTIIAKGMINNLRTYNIKGNASNGSVGLYPNYPFNTIMPEYNNTNINNHNYLYNDPYIKTTNSNGDISNQNIHSELLTFHSPDTSFRNPFLSSTELKTYGVLRGNSLQKFINPSKHPKHKLISDVVAIISFALGIAEMAMKLRGEITINDPGWSMNPVGGDITAPIAGAASAALSISEKTKQEGELIYYTQGGAMLDGLASIIAIPGVPVFPVKSGIDLGFYTASTAASVGGTLANYHPTTYTVKMPKHLYSDPVTRTVTGIQQALLYFTEGTETALRLLYAVLPYEQYALQHVAHGFYSNFTKTNGLKRFKLEDSIYVKNNFQQLNQYLKNDVIPYQASFSLNNLNRQDTVFLRTSTGPFYDVSQPLGVSLGPSLLVNDDTSLVTLGNINDDNTMVDRPTFKETVNPFAKKIASYYAGLKNRLKNQYGQLESIKLVSVPGCSNYFNYQLLQSQNIISCGKLYTHKKFPKTTVLFGGDTYINRYTEKNTMLFFYNWLYGQPNGTELNYFINQNIPEPRFWANTSPYDPSYLTEAISDPLNSTTPSTGSLPSRFYNLDNTNYDYETDTLPILGFGPFFPNLLKNYPGIFTPRDSYFYLGVMSVRDFYVESDVLVDFRDNGEYPWEQHYDPYRYTSLEQIFEINPDNITKGNYYSYDYSLSISKLFTQYYSSGNLQSRYYDAKIASQCYTHYPDRIIYSLPQQQESFKQSWLVYLANNYKEFESKLSGVKSFAKTGLFLTFENDSPLMYNGVDTLQTEQGTKLTIGDGGLFSQTPQNVSNADVPYEYGSSQNRLSVISTPVGLYYISQNQGKIFNFSEGLKEISQLGMKWWFNLFLPYKLLEDFPNYKYTDNAVSGISCQSIYDNKNGILYFTKKDYKLKPQYQGLVTNIDSYFVFNNDKRTKYKLGDELLFDDASWTVSFDPKSNFWISHHDWHPNLLLPSKDSLLTIKENTIWKHNNTCTSYCNFYGQDYPFEVEFPITTGQQVTSLRNIEYFLESYVRDSNCVDQFHLLDHNFDELIIYNTEQTSGYLNLNLYPKNNPFLALQYPIINPTSIDVLYTKEENKYRVNQFWDVTRDRGEFPIGLNYPPVAPLNPGETTLQGNYSQNTIFLSDPNGYTKTLNPINLNYNKQDLQRKKFRHYVNFINLSKQVSGNVNMLVKIINSKNLISIR